MAVATFDTLKFANTLKAAGVPDKQAEAQAVAFAEMVQVNFKELATKEDLGLLKLDLDHAVEAVKRDITDLKTEIKHDLQTMQAKQQADSLLLKWMLGATFTGVIAGIGLLSRLLFTQGR